MSKLYAYSRKFINRRRFFKLIAMIDLYSVLGGLWIWWVWDMVDGDYMVNKDGQLNGLYVYGVYMTLVIVIAHHLQVVMNIRNWTWFMTRTNVFGSKQKFDTSSRRSS